jgi:lysophospholipase L1-like esterase
VGRLQRETAAALVFATTTPVLDERHAQRGAAFDRFQADVRLYNVGATAVMREAGVPVLDLHAVVEEGGVELLLATDGTHYTPEGYARLAAAVADRVLAAARERAQRG